MTMSSQSHLHAHVVFTRIRRWSIFCFGNFVIRNGNWHNRKTPFPRSPSTQSMHTPQHTHSHISLAKSYCSVIKKTKLGFNDIVTQNEISKSITPLNNFDPGGMKGSTGLVCRKCQTALCSYYWRNARMEKEIYKSSIFHLAFFLPVGPIPFSRPFIESQSTIHDMVVIKYHTDSTTLVDLRIVQCNLHQRTTASKTSAPAWRYCPTNSKLV